MPTRVDFCIEAGCEYLRGDWCEDIERLVDEVEWCGIWDWEEENDTNT